MKCSYKNLKPGDLFTIGDGKTIYAKKNDGEYIVVRSETNHVGSLCVAALNQVNLVLCWNSLISRS